MTEEREERSVMENVASLQREEDDVLFKDFSTNREFMSPASKDESKHVATPQLTNLETLFSSLNSSMVKPQSYKKALTAT